MDPSGMLTVVVIEGRNLAVKDFGGSSDPYGVVMLNGREPAVRTTTAMKTLNPSWNEEFALDVYGQLASNTLVVELYDWDRLSADDFMGEIRIALGPLTNEEGVDRWEKVQPSARFPKEKVRGDLHVKLSFSHGEAAEDTRREDYKHIATWALAAPQQLAERLLDAKPNNELARAITHVLASAPGRFAPVFFATADHEIGRTKQEGSLFRTDVWATKLYTAFSKTVGLPFLDAAVGEAVRALCADPAGLELDPTRLAADADTEANTRRLTAACERVFDSVRAAAPGMPAELRTVLIGLRERIAAVFPDSQLKLVGGFFFLRFVCPAIWQPDVHGLIGDPPGDVERRALVLVSKTIMNLSNGVEFGAKEPYMTPMNEFIAAHTDDIRAFFESISTPAPAGAPATTFIPYDYRARDLVVVEKHLKVTPDDAAKVQPSKTSAIARLRTRVAALEPASKRVELNNALTRGLRARVSQSPEGAVRLVRELLALGNDNELEAAIRRNDVAA